LATFSGIDGYVIEGATQVIGGLNSWSITITHAPVDVRVFRGDGWGAYAKGAKDWTGSASGFFDCTDTGQTAIHTAITGGTTVDVYMHVRDDYYYYGSTHPTSISVDQALDGVANISYDFQGIGAIGQRCA